MKDIRQSNEFASFMQDIGWRTEKLSGNRVYIRKFPLFGAFAKCSRPEIPIELTEFKNFIKNNHISTFKIAPNILINNNYLSYKKRLLSWNFKIDIDPFNPTTSIIVDLKRKEEDIFKSFSEAKRRAVRKAIKNGVNIEISDKYNEFIKIRKEHFAPLGFLIVPEMKALWKNFYPQKADLLLAKTRRGKAVAGIFMLYHKQIAYYWYASAFKEGKKLFAPSLLVWEAIKLAKKKGAKILDFEGVVDERFPKASKSWRGFTKFKEGFLDKKTIYMENFYFKKSPLI